MGGKGKLKKFEEIQHFKHVIQPTWSEIFQQQHPLKGKWNELIFKNNNPIVLELGCGKGEYTVGLASLYPDKNFIGVDIKGARIYTGAKQALEKKLNNVFFLRSRIDFIDSFFQPEEVSEIWIPFPDPQPQESREKKRLTSIPFMNKYKKFLKPQAWVHLKTDNTSLYEYTLQTWKNNHFTINFFTSDLYHTTGNFPLGTKEIQTFYENMFLNEQQTIKYVSCCL